MPCLYFFFSVLGLGRCCSHIVSGFSGVHCTVYRLLVGFGGRIRRISSVQIHTITECLFRRGKSPVPPNPHLPRNMEPKSVNFLFRQISAFAARIGNHRSITVRVRFLESIYLGVQLENT